MQKLIRKQEVFLPNGHSMYTGQISFTLFIVLGMWRPLLCNSKWKIWFYRFYSCIMIMIYFSFPISFLMFLFQIFGDINIFTEYLFYFLYSVAIVIKQISIIAKRETIMESKGKLLANICKPRDFYELDVLEKCSQDCRWKVLLFLLLSNVTGATILMSPLIKQNKTILPLRGWYPYSLDTRVMFFITYIYQIVAVLMSVCITASVEGLALTLMLQISAQLDVCVHRIQFLPKICRKFANSELCIHQEESKLIKDCVKHHRHIYLMGKDLNNLFSGVIFVHFFASVVSLCVIIYQLSRLGTKNPTYWIMISSVGTILTQTFLYCYYGEKIIEKSTEVADSIYEINWIHLKNTTKRDLIVMMSKAAKPIKLTGASIMVMSIKTFIKILRSAYSAYNLLANI